MTEHIGIIAGSGSFPRSCAVSARQSGDYKVTALAIRGFAPRDLDQYVDEIHWFELGQVGKLIKTCKANGIQKVTFAGKIEHVNLLNFQRFDTRALKIFYRLPDKRAETVLRAIMEELEGEDIQLLDPSIFLRSSLAKPGLLTPRRPLTKSEDKDVSFGYSLAREIADLDIGQTVVVKNQLVVAVEGVEGTDRCIERAAEYVGEGIVVVKVSRPNQDFRFDLPVIGLGTLKKIREVRGSCLAISAGECIFFDQEESIEIAESSSIAITAI